VTGRLHDVASVGGRPRRKAGLIKTNALLANHGIV